MKPEKRAAIWPVVLALTIFTLSGAKEIATPDIGLNFSKDKLGHFLVFGLLATSILRVPRLKRLGWRGAASAAMIAIIYGGFDELRQSLTPGRSVEFADWIADTLGAVVAVLVYTQLKFYQRILEWQVLPPKKQRTSGALPKET